MEAKQKSREQNPLENALPVMPVVRRHENYQLVSDHWALNFIKWCGAVLVSLWLSFPGAIQLLLILCGFDLLSCLFTKRAGLFNTLRRIAVTMLLCGAVYVVYGMARNLSGFNLGFEIGTGVAGFYILGEIVTITLNCSTVIRIPPKLVEWLEKAEGITGEQKTALKDLQKRAKSD